MWGKRDLAVVCSGLLLVLVAGCSTADAPASRVGTSPTAQAAPGEAQEAPVGEVRCRVRGFTPSDRIVVTSVEPRIVYGRSFALAPGGSNWVSVGEADAFQEYRVGLRASSDDVRVPADVARTVLASGGAEIVDGRAVVTGFAREVRNRSGENRSYFAYVAAPQETGRWSSKQCGGTVNDGRSVTVLRGTFHTIGETVSGVAVCGRPEQAPRWLGRTATRLAC